MSEALKGGSEVLGAECEFCEEFAGGSMNAFYARYKETLRSRVLLSSENFRVFPSLGQLLEGHLLIAPLVHYTALAEMPIDLVSEFLHTWRHVRTVVSQVYGPCICFEHGARGPLNGGCGIYHAHLHATPLTGVADPVDTLKQRFPYVQLGQLNQISDLCTDLPCYLLYQDSKERIYLFNTGPLPSQYMRKLLADALGVQDWDWRSTARDEKLLTAMRRLSGKFDVTLSSLL